MPNIDMAMINGSVNVITAGSSYSCSVYDRYVIVNKTSGSATAITLASSPATGTMVTIKDGKGDANANNITISPAAGTIDGASSVVINLAYSALLLIYNGTQWNIV